MGPDSHESLVRILRAFAPRMANEWFAAFHRAAALLRVATFCRAAALYRAAALRWVTAILLTLAVVPGASASRESGSLLSTEDQRILYVANLDAGSISKIDRQSGDRLAELRLGKSIRRIALSGDESLLLASDDLANRLYLVDAGSFSLRRTISTPDRPMGIVYDERRELFWVAVYEAGMLLGVDRKGRIQIRTETLPAPRGLALLQDGRLLISHALTGEVSIHENAGLAGAKVRVVSLHESQNPDEKVSQGLPRMLDDIAISPDGREAWLPHLLWNFDHPFQFQSTVFPTVSILDLEPGAEREREGLRKHLFKQINILDKAGKTRIVSNPHDLAFSPSGKKAYVTLAGSEDLMVFDLSRRSRENQTLRKRRKGKQSKGGAQAIQILRHLPGQNPRGIAVTDDAIYVQNAMSLDMTRLARGGDSPFDRVKFDIDRFAVPVETDPLAPSMRRGIAIFHNGNTDRFPANPIAGDFWMSCSSCHIDGFNFSNGFLMQDTRGEDLETAIRGHQNMGRMVAGDFVGDYIRMIQDTQGGMGHDTNQTAAAMLNPEAPPGEVIELMEDLHTYVVRKENLPLLATWLRVTAEDSSDDAPVHRSAWKNSAECAECHPQIFDQWSNSNHRLMGASNPYYLVSEDLAAESEGEEFRTWCMGCHNPEGVLSGDTSSHGASHLFERDGKSLRQALASGSPSEGEGTGCLFCHRIDKIERAGGNAGIRVNLRDRETYVFEASRYGILRSLAEVQINSKPEIHTASYSNSIYRDEALCGACHDEFAPGTGSLIVDTFGEWQASPYNNPDDPKKHRGCIDCHMHAEIGSIGKNVAGRSTEGGTMKSNVVTHHFSGANHFLAGLRSAEHEAMSLELLRSAAEIETSLDGNALRVRVTNVGAGHHLPTGVADLRQLWLQVRVSDEEGKLIVESGALRPDGRLPEDAGIFGKLLGDREGNPVGLRFWRYEKLLADTRIPARQSRDLFFPLPEDIRFPLQAEVRLVFRVMPQWVTDIVRQSYPELPVPPTVELSLQTTRFERP
jgi:DNA-binding beta-propeller fold protein YncE